MRTRRLSQHAVGRVLFFSYCMLFASGAMAQENKVFDWQGKDNEQEVDHPFYEKGLIRIDKDRKYIYKVDESEQKRAISVRMGFLELVNLENPDQAGQAGASFDENYDASNAPAVLVDYEWELFKSPLGKFNLKAGAGAFYAQGNGHFVSGTNENLEPREVFTFFAIPLSAGAVYRMQIWHNQLLVPYAEGGGTAFGFAEFRDDDKGPKFGGAPAAYFAGGGALNLTYFDALSRIMLDREYGINRIYLTGEYRAYVGLSQNYDFTSDFFNGGLLMEF